MRNGPNLLKLARKEHCLALLAQLRNKFKTDGKIHRVFPNGEVQYLHPKDGVYPEKVNKGREAVGSVDRRIGANPNPINVSCAALPLYVAHWHTCSALFLDGVYFIAKQYMVCAQGRQAVLVV